MVYRFRSLQSEYIRFLALLNDIFCIFFLLIDANKKLIIGNTKSHI